MPSFDAQAKFNKIPTSGLVLENTATDLATPSEGLMEVRNDLHQAFVYLNGAWVRFDNAGISSAPTGPAGGDLSGTYPNPTVANNAITSAKIADGTIVAADLAPGTIPTSLPPSGTAGGDLAGTYPNPTIGVGKVTGNHILDGTILVNDLGTSLVEAGVSGGTAIPAAPALRRIGILAGDAMDGQATLSGISTNNPATGSIDANSQKIINVQNNPTGGTDAANKNYVDSVAQGLDAKASVRMRVIAVPGPGYNTGTGTWPSVIGIQDPSGLTPNSGDRVMVDIPGGNVGNGIFIFTPTFLTRATDMDAWAEVPGAFVFVEEGTSADTGWVSTANQGGAMGTTPITWTQFSSAGNYTGGNGLTLTGLDFSVNVDNASIEIAADILRVKALGITGAMLAVGAVDLASNKVTGMLPIANGGTNANNANLARVNLAAAGVITLPSPALTAGTWTAVSGLTLGARPKDVTFEIADSGDPGVREFRVLDWRCSAPSPTATLDIRCDVPGGRLAGFYNVNVFA